MSPPRAQNTADAKLERILYILPAAARGEIRIEEIARALDVDAATVLRDLEDATARAFYHPAGTVESFSITTDGRTVQVHAPHEFRRPARLSQGETMALGLGLRALAADADPERRRRILALAQRLEDGLAAPSTVRDDAVAYTMAPSAAIPAVAGDVEYEELELAFDDDGFRGVIADAIEQGRVCTIAYLKPGDVAPMQRRIAPYRLVYARGTWYVAAHDVHREGLRIFRMDRMLDAQLETDAAPPAPAALEQVLAQGVPYAASDEVEVSVRYSPRIARWIAERTATQLEHDGSAVVRHRVADPRWIVRHVLQYAGDAVVEEPAQARAWIASAASRVGSA
jgi:predicted DNA-binding transcriptional regulator YafY